MAEKTRERCNYRAVDREFQNIRELLELLMCEMSVGDKKLRSGPPLGWAPPTDVYETVTELVVTMDVAGVDPAQIQVTAGETVMTIRGVRHEVSPGSRKHFHKMEIEIGPFQRRIQLPPGLDLDSISTGYSDGLFEVRVRKMPGTERRSIDIE